MVWHASCQFEGQTQRIEGFCILLIKEPILSHKEPEQHCLAVVQLLLIQGQFLEKGLRKLSFKPLEKLFALNITFQSFNLSLQLEAKVTLGKLDSKEVLKTVITHFLEL